MERVLFIDDHPNSCLDILNNIKSKFKSDIISDIDPEKIPLDYDAYIVDVHLQTFTGDKLIKYLRKRGADGVFILLTADDICTSIQKYYQDYVDDYLSKNYTNEEILKRIEIALVKKANNTLMKNIISFNTINIHPSKCATYVNKKVIDLTFVEYKMLLSLLRSINNKTLQGMSKENLIDLVWPEVSIDKKTVNTHIGNLNKKIIESGIRFSINRKGIVHVDCKHEE